jgi:mRNA interferase MazF
MTNYQAGDLVLVSFPFAGGTQVKTRPGLIILDSGDADVVVARVTTQMYQTGFDVAIQDWSGAGLLAPSVVRLHKLATLEKVLVARTLGILQATDRQKVSHVLQQIFGNW